MGFYQLPVCRHCKDRAPIGDFSSPLICILIFTKPIPGKTLPGLGQMRKLNRFPQPGQAQAVCLVL
jgi:hypothetical protein